MICFIYQPYVYCADLYATAMHASAHSCTCNAQVCTYTVYYSHVCLLFLPLMQLWQVMRALQAMVAAKESFVTTDYMMPTPDWAVYGAHEAGFDPQETRFKKIRNHPQKQALRA